MERAELGKEILVTRRGRPAIRLVPASDGSGGRGGRAADPSHGLGRQDQQPDDGHEHDLLRDPGVCRPDGDHDAEQQEEDHELERNADQPQHHH
jgi:antitoxin (DNA-binding transcriptional repressor) of toxin-antitoxin stability system